MLPSSSVMRRVKKDVSRFYCCLSMIKTPVLRGVIEESTRIAALIAFHSRASTNWIQQRTGFIANARGAEENSARATGKESSATRRPDSITVFVPLRAVPCFGFVPATGTILHVSREFHDWKRSGVVAIETEHFVRETARTESKGTGIKINETQLRIIILP